MSFIPRLAVAAVAGVMLAAPAAAAYAQTPSPTPAPEATAETTATATPSTSATPSGSPSPNAAPDTTPTTTPNPDPTPEQERVFNVTPGGCGLVGGVSTEFVRVTVFQPGKFTVEIDGTVVGNYTDHLDTGFPTGEGTVTVRVIGGGKTIAKTVEIPNVCNTTSPTPAPSPTPTGTPTQTPRGTVTAKYECGAAHFTNNGTEPVTIYAGTVDSDSIEAKFDLAPGKSRTVESTTKDFGWIAWENGVQEGEPAGYLGAPGEDLSCDEPDDSVTPTPKPGESRGLANTGGENGKDGTVGTTSVTIKINGTTITVTAPGNGKPVITTNGETVTPDAPKATPSATPTATPTPTPTPSDTQDEEIADQQDEQGEPGQAGALSVADEIFRLTNEFRAENNLPPFERDTCLDKTAEKQSEIMVGQMAEQDDIFHSDLEDADNCPDTNGVGENIAAGQPDAATAVEDWKNSTEGHREAMLSTKYTHMGVGVTADNTYTQQFTTRDKSAQPAATVEPEPAAEPAGATEAPATGLKAEQGLTPAATSLLQAVHQKWPNLEIGGVGQRTGESDHPSGNAIDIMTGGNACSPVGQKIADWAKSNADSLGVQYVIWCEKIWSVERASEGWRPNTGHQDHVHISVTGDTATKA